MTEELGSGAPQMTPRERAVLNAIKQAARNGQPCPSNMDLTVLLDCESLSTPVRALQQLEAKGYVQVERYQQGRQVWITGTDLATAPPKHRAVHWRDRTG